MKKISLSFLVVALAPLLGVVRLTVENFYLDAQMIGSVEVILSTEPTEVLWWLPPVSVSGDPQHTSMRVTVSPQSDIEDVRVVTGQVTMPNGEELAVEDEEPAVTRSAHEGGTLFFFPLAGMADWGRGEAALRFSGVLEFCTRNDGSCSQQRVNLDAPRDRSYRVSSFWWDVLASV